MRTTFDEDSHILYTVAEGTVTKAEVVEEVRYIWRTYDAANLPGLADFSGADVSQISALDIIEIAKISNEQDRGEAARLALVVDSKLGYGLGRMYNMIRETIAGESGRLGIFQDLTSAESWLLE